MVSFSQFVKEEIIRNELPTCSQCLKAELAAILHMAGSIHLSGSGGVSLSVTVESAGVIRHIVRIIKMGFQLQGEIRMENVEKLGKHHRYSLLIPHQERLAGMLDELGVLTKSYTLEADIKSELVKGNCCRAAFIRGAFLGGGSITDPQKKTYHLEMVTGNEDFANGLSYLMHLVGMRAKISQRKNRFIVYLKDSEVITSFLSLIRAHTAVIRLEEVRVIKELREEANRLVNCETANLEKSLAAAWEQSELLTILEQRVGLNNLPKRLQETAKLRQIYPEATLKELGEYHLPPLSKSAVNHRWRQMREIAKKFQ